MKIYKLPQLAESNPGMEYRLAPESNELGAVFLVYGTIRPGEAPRKTSSGPGREEVYCVIKGSLKVSCGRSSFSVSAGEAFRAGSGDAIYLENPGSVDAVYLASGSMAAKQADPAQQARKEEAPQGIPAAPDDNDGDEFEITTDDDPEAEEEKIG